MAKDYIDVVLEMIKSKGKELKSDIHTAFGNKDVQLYYFKNNRKVVIGYIKKCDSSFSEKRPKYEN